MKKYAVEIEMLYTYVVEADNKQNAEWIARMSLASHEPPLDGETASVYVEELDPDNNQQHDTRRNHPTTL